MPALNDTIKYIILTALVAFPLFGHLDSLPIRLWDESRLAVNAYEMMKGDNIFVTHFMGDPEMWNTKPPLLIWLQALSMSLFGVDEISIRLPSVLAAAVLFAFLVVFSKRHLKNTWFAFIVILILTTANGYIDNHAVRTGDYDSLLVLFMTISGLLFYSYIVTKKTKYLYGFFISLGLAVLTKSIAGLLFLPGMLIFLLVEKQFISFITNKHTYFGLLAFLFMVLGFYLTREFFNPGYLEAVYNNELGGRYLESLEGHDHGFWYYFNLLKDTRFYHWLYLFPCGAAIGFFVKNEKINKLVSYSFILTLSYFLVISYSRTKLEWYDLPMYPFMAIIIGSFIFYIFDWLEKDEQSNRNLFHNTLPYIFLFLMFLNPYRDMANKIYMPEEKNYEEEMYRLTYFLKKATEGKYDLHGKYLAKEGYMPHNHFYMLMLQEQGISFSEKQLHEISPTDSIIAYQPNIKNEIEKNFNYTVTNEVGPIKTYVIHGKENQ